MKFKICSSALSRFIGLRFSRKLKKNEAIIIVNPKEGIFSSGIDMLFVFYSIDVFWLDKNKKIVDVLRNARPFSLTKFPRKPAKYIVETLPRVINATVGESISSKAFKPH